jgi:hypothetical protein
MDRLVSAVPGLLVLARRAQGKAGVNQTEPHKPENRRFVRYEVQATVELSVQGQRRSVETDDLGAGGCRLTLAQPLEKGSTIMVRLHSRRTKREASGSAVVAWASAAEPYRVGLSFSDAVAEQVIPFMQDLLGDVAISTPVRKP